METMMEEQVLLTRGFIRSIREIVEQHPLGVALYSAAKWNKIGSLCLYVYKFFP